VGWPLETALLDAVPSDGQRWGFVCAQSMGDEGDEAIRRWYLRRDAGAMRADPDSGGSCLTEKLRPEGGPGSEIETFDLRTFVLSPSVNHQRGTWGDSSSDAVQVEVELHSVTRVERPSLSHEGTVLRGCHTPGSCGTRQRR
jgi:hypothetical protein